MGKEEIFHIRDEHVGSKSHFKSQTSQSYIFLQKLFCCAEFRSNLSIINVIHSRKDGQVIEDFHGNTDNPFVFATFLFFSRWDFSPRKIPFLQKSRSENSLFCVFFLGISAFFGLKVKIHYRKFTFFREKIRYITTLTLTTTVCGWLPTFEAHKQTQVQAFARDVEFAIV